MILTTLNAMSHSFTLWFVCTPCANGEVHWKIHGNAHRHTVAGFPGRLLNSVRKVWTHNPWKNCHLLNLHLFYSFFPVLSLSMTAHTLNKIFFSHLSFSIWQIWIIISLIPLTTTDPHHTHTDTQKCPCILIITYVYAHAHTPTCQSLHICFPSPLLD